MIAGDVFDGDWRDASIGLFFNRQFARLANRVVPVYFLRGNHDAESVVTKSLTWPDGVFEFSTRRPGTYRSTISCRAARPRVSAPRRRENYAVDYPDPVAG